MNIDLYMIDLFFKSKNRKTKIKKVIRKWHTQTVRKINGCARFAFDGYFQFISLNIFYQTDFCPTPQALTFLLILLYIFAHSTHSIYSQLLFVFHPHFSVHIHKYIISVMLTSRFSFSVIFISPSKQSKWRFEITKINK